MLDNRGSLELRGDPDFYNDGVGALPRIDNSGTLVKTAGVSRDGIAHSADGTLITIFNNSGSVIVHAGVLAMLDGGVSSGSFHGDLGTDLYFSGDHILTGPISGDGITFNTWPAGGSAAVSGTYQATAYTYVGCPTTFSGAVLGVGELLLIHDFADFRSNSISVHALELDGPGTLTGSGDLTVEGQFDWAGGTLGGSGAAYVAGDAAMNISGGKHYLNGRTLTNAGAAVWSARRHRRKQRPSV